uniref:Cytochrome P450 n=1 Tax=Alexandrium monilatum TaxID=311494 RepID=A0A7S4R836_9DINO
MAGALAARPGPIGLAIAAAVGLLIRRHRNLPKNVVYVHGYVPVVGVLMDIVRALKANTHIDMLHEWFGKLGKTFAFVVPGRSFVATIDPEVIEHVLKTNFENYIKGPLFQDPFTELLGDGIFNVDGELWRQQRKTSSRLFSKKLFETHIWNTVQANTSKVMGILDAEQGSTLDMFGLLNRFTLDTIGQVGFSKSVGSLEDPSSPFLRSFDRAQQVLILRFWTNPLWKVFRLLNIGVERELREHLRLLDDYSRTIVRDLLAKSTEGEDGSLVGLFVREMSAAEKADPQMETYLRDLVMNFLIAGRDTTAQCLAWTIFELSQHPEVVGRACEEIKAVLSKGPLTYASLKELKYLSAVVDEGLRLHPSVPYDGKGCVRDDVLPGGIRIRAGTAVMFCPYAQGRCKELWGQDAEAFRPERWLEMKSRPSDFAYSAFNAGPRICLGKSLAYLEMTAFLARLLDSFDLELQVKPEEIQYDTQLTLGMKGLPIKAISVR